MSTISTNFYYNIGFRLTNLLLRVCWVPVLLWRWYLLFVFKTLDLPTRADFFRGPKILFAPCVCHCLIIIDKYIHYLRENLKNHFL